MHADLIIFDKDGTLMDFDAYWVTVSRKAIAGLLSRMGRTDIPMETILSALGVKNGRTDIDGVLCKGTYEQMGRIVYDVLTEYRCDVTCGDTVQAVIDAYRGSADAGEIKPACDNIAEVLTTLKGRNKTLMVATTDSPEMTHHCLCRLGIWELFDGIYTDDGTMPPKPDPFLVSEIGRTTGIPKERMVMVGDTMTDIRFAENAGISVIGVAADPENAKRLSPYADAVVPDISYLAQVID
ncbi:MAG: HAD family hydrolase [Eubacteriales bacterium]